MKRTLFALLMLCMVLAVAGCGGGDDSPPLVVTEILSDVNVDGDIMFDPVADSFTITQLNDNATSFTSLLAGIDPFNIDPATSQEYRAFLDFPLGSVPPNASIRSATLDIVIKTREVVSRTDNIPMLIELVSLGEQLLVGDFDQLPLTNTIVTFSILSTDVSPPNEIPSKIIHRIIDVTPLMREAQAGVFSNFQIRLSQAYSPFLPRGIIEIDESTDATAPLLTVVYF